MIDYEKTIISQYANSPTICALIANMNEYIDHTANFADFLVKVWNVNTALGFGLDIWGRIVGVDRVLHAEPTDVFFGFKQGLGSYKPFGQAPFRYETSSTGAYSLTDSAYRKLIMVKALANITQTTTPTLNQILLKLFPEDRGRCYVADLGAMSMQYVFEFEPNPVEWTIITNSGVLPRPAGVLVSYVKP